MRLVAPIIGIWWALICLGSGQAAAAWTALDGTLGASLPFSMTLIEKSTDGFIAEFTLQGFEVADGEEFDRLSIPNSAYVGEIGKPALPSIRKLIQIPAQSDFRVEIIDIDSEDLEGFFIYPQQPFVTDDQPPPPFVIDAGTYASDRPFPERHVEVGRPAVWGGLRTATLIVNPLRFNPQLGRLTAARRIRFKVAFNGINDQNTLASEPEFVSPNRRRMFLKTLFNFDEELQPPARADAQTTYLIIVDEILKDHEKIGELAARHEESGHSVEIAVAQDIAGDEPAADIKEYIRGIYEQSSPPLLEYVLLIGDRSLEHIPWIEGATGKYGDTFYTFLEGDDFLSDIALGRFPAKTEDELEIMIDKFLFWSGDDFGGDWLGISLLAAHRQGYPDKYTATCEDVRTYEYRLPPPIFTTQYGGEEATNESVSQQINEGRIIISYRGHGNSMSWLGWSSLGEYFNTDDVSILGNHGRPSILLSIACENADMSRNDPCFAESWLIHPTGGAAAVLGSIYASYTTPNDEFNKYLFKAIYDDGITSMGDVINKANADLYAHFTGDPIYEDYTRKNIEMYLWLGDPAMSLPLTELDAPYDLNARALDTSRIILEWIDQSEDEDYFILEMAQSGGGDWQVLENLPANETSFEYDDLTEAQGAFFRLKAVQGETQSYYSNVVYAQTLAAAPTNLHALAQSVSSIRLTWTDNSQGETSQKVFRRRLGESTFQEIAEKEADVAVFIDEGLHEGSFYEYVVEAITSGGGARNDESALATTLPAAPVELAAESRQDLTVTLQWRDASDGEERFVVYRKAPAETENWEIIGYAPADAAGYTDSAAREAQQLAYAISAENSGGIGPKSETCFALTVPAPPRALIAEPISDSAVALRWSDFSQGESHWSLSRSFDGEIWNERAMIPANAESYTDSGLAEGLTVLYRLYAVNEAGASQIGNIAQTRTLPKLPAKLDATIIDHGILLAWADSSDVENGYRIERRIRDAEFETIATVGENDNTYVDASAPARKLTYRVAAFHEFGDSEYSEHAEITQPDGESNPDGSVQGEYDQDGEGRSEAGDDEQSDQGGGCGW